MKTFVLSGFHAAPSESTQPQAITVFAMTAATCLTLNYCKIFSGHPLFDLFEEEEQLLKSMEHFAGKAA